MAIGKCLLLHGGAGLSPDNKSMRFGDLHLLTVDGTGTRVTWTDLAPAQPANARPAGQ